MKKKVPHFRRIVLYSEWGRSPEGEEGAQYSHVRGRKPLLNFIPHAHSFGACLIKILLFLKTEKYLSFPPRALVRFRQVFGGGDKGGQGTEDIRAAERVA